MPPPTAKQILTGLEAQRQTQVRTRKRGSGQKGGWDPEDMKVPRAHSWQARHQVSKDKC